MPAIDRSLSLLCIYMPAIDRSNDDCRYWHERHIEANDPVVAQVIEAPATDLVEMLLKHVDFAQEKLEEARTALDTSRFASEDQAKQDVYTARQNINEHVADPGQFSMEES